MGNATNLVLDLLFIIGGPLLGGYIGYRVAIKRGASPTLGVAVGILAGPCLGWLICLALPAVGTNGNSWAGAGRSFSADESPRLRGKE